LRAGYITPVSPLAIAIGKLFGWAVEEIFGDDSHDARGDQSAKERSAGKAKGK
jgi:DNA-binding XRE family transcriptional regulator